MERAGALARRGQRAILDQAPLEAAVRKKAKSIADVLIEEGLERGLEQGLERGRTEGARNVVLRVLARRGVALSQAVRARIEACTDLATLEDLIDRAVTIAQADELFAR
jgi:flagellar biosynthesis/type III secretory pathway protein FliH